MTRARIGRFVLVVVMVGGLVFGISGQWRDPILWAYLGMWAAVTAYALLFVIDEDLARERFRPPEAGADRAALVWVRLTALGHVVLSALDLRWHLTPIPSTVRMAAIAATGAAFLMVFQSMRQNRFFSAVIRVQRERGHHVIDRGLYAHVRHPGYAGMILGVPLSGLALGSGIGVGIGLVYSALILRRVTFEDAFLRRNLEGYDHYAARVRFRLVPGVW